jgi:hypothetical protein
MQHIHRRDGLASGNLIRLRDYWLRLRGDRAMPARKDFNPLDVRHLLPHVVLTEVHEQPRRLRYRLIGTFVTALAGRDATGQWLDRGLYGDRLDDFLWAYRTCLDRREPVAVREHVQFSPKDWITIEALLMPMGDGDVANMVLSGVDTVPTGTVTPSAGASFVLDWRLAAPD